MQVNKPMETWNHFCLTFENKSKQMGIVSIVLNGNIILKNEMIHGKGIPYEFMEHITIMRRSLPEYGAHNSIYSTIYPVYKKLLKEISCL